MPLSGNWVTVLFKLKVINSGDSASMKAVQFLFKLKHGLKPATIRRTVMKKFGGICEGRRPVQHPAFDETTLFRKIKDRNTIASDGNGSLRG
jgi:hypothetical protein